MEGGSEARGGMGGHAPNTERARVGSETGWALLFGQPADTGSPYSWTTAQSCSALHMPIKAWASSAVTLTAHSWVWDGAAPQAAASATRRASEHRIMSMDS